MDLGEVANNLDPLTSGSEAGRVTIDKGVAGARIHGFPNAEHTVIVDSKRGKRDRAPRALTLRQSVQAHLSLPRVELLTVSDPPNEPGNWISGPQIRHGRPSLLERISGMEEIINSQPVSVPATRLGTSACPYPSSLPRQAAMQPQRLAGTNSNVSPTEEGAIDIDNQPPTHNHISNVTHNSGVTAHADRSDRALRVDTDDQRIDVRVAKMKVMVEGVLPTALTSPPIPPFPSTSAEPGEITPLAPVDVNLRSKLLERLDGERKRAIGAASGEPEVEPVTGKIGEDSLRAELRARSRLRMRLVVAKGDCHVDVLEP